MVNKLTTRVEGIVKPLSPELPCWMMLDCDNDLYPLIEEQLKAELSLKTGRIFRLMAGKGLGAFDARLDKRWDSPGILVAITLSLPASPREEDADAVSMVVLSNRKANAAGCAPPPSPRKGNRNNAHKDAHPGAALVEDPAQ